jgi:NADPH-dependent 2,4-dienoyl-CoA reductase/sulfur reductase-like enzyme
MKQASVDVVVVGAGPAGMTTATRVARAGLSVVLLDEQEAAGGQIYRSITRTDARRLDLLGPDYAAGKSIASALMTSEVLHETRAQVWQVTQDRTVHYMHRGQSKSLVASHIVLATGAMERPFPIPGWTLPGVMTAGAAQILLKGSGTVPRQPVVLAGCGPLLYLLAWQYLRAGVAIRAIVETNTATDMWKAAPHLPGALRGWPDLVKGMRLLQAIRSAHVPVYKGATDVRIEGKSAASAISFTAKAKSHRIDAELILLHQGVVPNTQITWSLQANHFWDAAQLCWVPKRNTVFEINLPDYFVVGDGGGIAGAKAAEAQGEICALEILRRQGKVSEDDCDNRTAQWRAQLSKHLNIRPFLDAFYRPSDAHRIPADDVIVCRCEEVTAGEIRQSVALGCVGPNQIKSFNRCGMGPCQGRFCGLTVTEIIADARGVPSEETGYYRIRPPIKPITLGELAGIHSDND